LRTDAERARTLLWERVEDANDPDPEQRDWKLTHVNGLLTAAAAIDLLDEDEIQDWRAALHGARPAPGAGDSARAAEHLEALAAAIKPLSRASDADAAEASGRFSAALEALGSVGLLAEDEVRRWRERALRSEAPWLGADETAEVAAMQGGGGIVSIGVPAQSPEEQAADALAQAEWDRLLLRGPVRTLQLTTPVRDEDGVAILAVVTREDTVEVHYHHVGGPAGELDPFEQFQFQCEHGLQAPRLEDDQGTTYDAVSATPVSSSGTGGTPDPERPVVQSGVWRYTPAAPRTVLHFTVTTATARWRSTSA